MGRTLRVANQEFRCDTDEDEDRMLEALSNAVRNRKPTAIRRSHGGSFRTAIDDDDIVHITTSSEHDTKNFRFRKKDVDETLQRHADH